MVYIIGDVEVNVGYGWRLLAAALLAAAVYAAADGSLESRMLAAHNAARAAVKTPPLVWSSKLADNAQRWADVLIKGRGLEHQRKSKYGENLFEMIGAKATPEDVVKRWTSEAVDYDHKKNRCRGTCGHYTQVVWRDTKEVGCAVAREGAREVWVCEYNPPGNYIGERPY